jgi:two-component system, OmpR family, response regulator
MASFDKIAGIGNRPARSLPVPADEFDLEDQVENPLRVYLVEDSAMIRGRVMEQVAASGHADIIGYAETEEEALAGILSLHPDAVVLDIQLRNGNGFNVLRRLHKLPVALRPVVIVFSDYSDAEFRRYAAREGANYFLNKGSEFHHLMGLLNLLSQREPPLR